jgi:predicted transcriptional regulator
MPQDHIMLRTQNSLTIEERRALDMVATRTDRSVSSLMRDAIETAY